MSKKSDYAARASECRLQAERAHGAARRLLLEAESAWRRLERACFETSYGPPPPRPTGGVSFALAR